MKVRQSARLLILDPDDRLLLFGSNGPPMDPKLEIDRFWHVPGGGLEPGETFEEAAQRELWEETGIREAEFGPCVWIVEKVLVFPGEIGEALSHERYFPAKVEYTEPVFDNLSGYEVEGISSYRWWKLEELQRTEDVVFPIDLPRNLESIIRRDYPDEPLKIR